MIARASTAVVATPVENTAARSHARITAIDALRGVALALMALTHAAFFIGVGMQDEVVWRAVGICRVSPTDSPACSPP